MTAKQPDLTSRRVSIGLAVGGSLCIGAGALSLAQFTVTAWWWIAPGMLLISFGIGLLPGAVIEWMNVSRFRQQYAEHEAYMADLAERRRVYYETSLRLFDEQVAAIQAGSRAGWRP